MNEELRKLVVAAGCPEEVMNELWFNIFINKFTHILITACEEELK